MIRFKTTRRYVNNLKMMYVKLNGMTNDLKSTLPAKRDKDLVEARSKLIQANELIDDAVLIITENIAWRESELEP